MSRYADPGACPDCRRQIPSGIPACPHCGLDLSGPAAYELFTTLQYADRLVATLRAASTSVPEPAYPPPPEPTKQRPELPSYASYRGDLEPTDRRPFGLNTVPAVLIGLGALCLLIAGLVFLVVAWALLGVGGRTVVLILFTAAAMAGGALLAVRGLRIGAEAVLGLALGLLVLDVTGVDSAGWLGTLPDGALPVLTGSLLLLGGGAFGLLGAHTPVGRIAVPEALTAVGLLVALIGLAVWSGSASTGLAVGLPVGTALAAGAWLVRLRVAGVGVLAVAAGCWLGLFALGLYDGLARPDVAAWWGEARVWPWLLAAVVPLVAVFVRALPEVLRVAAAGTAAVLVTGVLTLPVVGESMQTVLVTFLAVLAVTTAALWLLPWPWLVAAAVPAVPALAGTVLAALLFVGAVLARIQAEPWSRPAGDTLRHPELAVAPWLVMPTALLTVVAILAASTVGRRVLTARAGAPQRPVPTSDALGLLGGVALLAAIVAFAGYDVPRWSVLVLLLLAVTGAVGLARAGTTGPLVLAVCLALVALDTAAASDVLTLVALLVVGVLAGLVDLRAPTTMRAAAAVVWVTCLGGLLWTGAHVLDPAGTTLSTERVALGAIAVMGALVVLRADPATQGAAGTVALASLGGVAHDATWLAAGLTVAGVFAGLAALRHPDRRRLGWLAGVLLALATWARLLDLGVDTVEWYTLPSGLALVGYGLIRITRADVSSWRALGSGVTLCLLPSLLISLVDPISVRALVLGLFTMFLLLGALGLRLAAPLVLAAGTLALLVLREAFAAQVLPQWVSIGIVGLLLLLIGVTWERRLQEFRRASAYVRALR